jgi:glycosyltransferase involved in cell wall biosynthesis
MAASIGPCLDALLAQSYPPDLTELIVIDNGSVDGTPDVIRRYPVRYLDETVRGAPSARNRGIAASRGEYVAFTDADCVPARTWLARLVAAAVDQGADVIAGAMAVLDPGSSLLAEYSATIGQYDPEVTMRHPRYPYAVTANLAVRRALLRDVGGFDPEFLNYDAADLFWRMRRRAPLVLGVARRAVVFYRTRRSLRGFIRQNFDYGFYCTRFQRKAADLAPPSVVVDAWARRVGSGLTGLGHPRWRWTRRLALGFVHVARETSLAAGSLAGRRRSRPAPGGPTR